MCCMIADCPEPDPCGRREYPASCTELETLVLYLCKGAEAAFSREALGTVF